jgi:hypothetical protein
MTRILPGTSVRGPSHRLSYSNLERFGLRIPLQALGRKLVALEDEEETLSIRWTERVPVPRRQPVDRALSQTYTRSPSGILADYRSSIWRFRSVYRLSTVGYPSVTLQ